MHVIRCENTTCEVWCSQYGDLSVPRRCRQGKGPIDQGELRTVCLQQYTCSTDRRQMAKLSTSEGSDANDVVVTDLEVNVLAQECPCLRCGGRLKFAFSTCGNDFRTGCCVPVTSMFYASDYLATPSQDNIENIYWHYCRRARNMTLLCLLEGTELENKNHSRNKHTFPSEHPSPQASVPYLKKKGHQASDHRLLPYPSKSLTTLRSLLSPADILSTAHLPGPT